MKHTEKVIVRSFSAQASRTEAGKKLGIVLGSVEKVIQPLPHSFVLSTVVFAFLEHVYKGLIAGQ